MLMKYVDGFGRYGSVCFQQFQIWSFEVKMFIFTYKNSKLENVTIQCYRHAIKSQVCQLSKLLDKNCLFYALIYTITQ